MASKNEDVAKAGSADDLEYEVLEMNSTFLERLDLLSSHPGHHYHHQEGDSGSDSSYSSVPAAATADLAILARMFEPGDEELVTSVLQEILGTTPADMRRQARREAWREEVKKVMEKRKEFQKSKMVTPAGKKLTPDGRSGKTVLSLSRLSPEWRKIFWDERTTFLFHGVAEALHEHAYRNVKEIASNLIVAREFLRTSRNALTCRLVCKSWKGSIDNARSAIVIPFMGFRHNWGKPVLCYDTLPTFHDMAPFNFRTKQRYAERNPFGASARKLEIGGAGVVGTRWKDNLPYHKEIVRLLQNWGSELWQVFIHFDDGVCPELVYEQLVKYLKLMPNLRYLAIYDNERTRDNSKFGQDDEDEHGRLKERIAKKPLPELHDLTSLSFNAFVPTPIIHTALIKYQQQLQFVSGKLGDENNLYGIPVFNTISNSPEAAPFEGIFPSLKELRLVYLNVQGSTDVENVFRNLRSLSQSPLRELRLVVAGIEHGPMIHLADNFSKRLAWKLPHLEKLFLALYFIDLTDLDFLSIPECMSLKELDLNYFDVEFEPGEEMGEMSSFSTDGETIQFQGYWYRLYDSNIWMLLPELRKVSIRISGKMGTVFSEVYTREGFKRQLRRD